MRKTRISGFIGILMVFAMIAAACGDDTTTTGAEKTSFVLFGAPTGVEADAMNGFLQVYNEAKGTDISFVGSSSFEEQLRIRVAGGNPPAVAFVPQPGSICPFVDLGALVSLEDMGFDIAQMETDHGKFWMDLGLCPDGKHYGVPWFPNFKSIIFYNKPAFDAAGYQIPATYEDLVALSAQMVADGQTPWCFGFGSGDATGWPGTDWIEDIVVRNSGGDFYGKWFRHEVPFNSPEIVDAFNLFGEIMFGQGFVNGGPENVAATTFQDSPIPMFAETSGDAPQCMMLKQGSFISNFFPVGQEDQASFFPFPTIGGNTGAMGGGDTIIVFKNDPAIVNIIKDWVSAEWECVLASPDGGTASLHGGTGVEGVERLPGNKDVSPDCYDTQGSKDIATQITQALATNNFVFDASDLMPPEVGQGTFWTGMVDWTRGTPAQDVADTIEASWPSS